MALKSIPKTTNTKTNAELRGSFDETDMIGVLRSRRLSWARHVWRAEDRTINKVKSWKPDRTRPSGRPRQWWSDQVRGDMKLL